MRSLSREGYSVSPEVRTMEPSLLTVLITKVFKSISRRIRMNPHDERATSNSFKLLNMRWGSGVSLHNNKASLLSALKYKMCSMTKKVYPPAVGSAIVLRNMAESAGFIHMQIYKKKTRVSINDYPKPLLIALI